MDSQEINIALEEYENVSELSGSVYVPSSGHDSGSENESFSDSGEDLSEGEQQQNVSPVH